MQTEVPCPRCGDLLRPTAGGMKTLCAQCGHLVTIEKEKTAHSSSAQTKEHRWRNVKEEWHVQTEDGKHYGPVSNMQLREWYEEGRITADCQLLRNGAAQWQWANDVFPELLQESQPAEQRSLPPQSALAPLPPRPPPTQSAKVIAPLDPSDFPTAGRGLRVLAPLRPVGPTYEELRTRSAEAAAHNAKYAPFMQARLEKPPLHPLLFVIAMGNFAFGFVRAVLSFIIVILNLISLGTQGRAEADLASDSLSLGLTIVMLALAITLISGGIGLLGQREWGRSATYIATIVDMIVLLSCMCVMVMLYRDIPFLGPLFSLISVMLYVPCILYDAFAAACLTFPSVVKDLEE